MASFSTTPQTVRADRFGYNIDLASEDIADASGQRVQAAEIRKTAVGRLGAQANSHIHVRTLGLTPRATDPKRDNRSTPAALN
jgi:hypothetical protein